MSQRSVIHSEVTARVATDKIRPHCLELLRDYAALTVTGHVVLVEANAG
jgi:hypothetical protein